MIVVNQVNNSEIIQLVSIIMSLNTKQKSLSKMNRVWYFPFLMQKYNVRRLGRIIDICDEIQFIIMYRINVIASLILELQPSQPSLQCSDPLLPQLMYLFCLHEYLHSHLIVSLVQAHKLEIICIQSQSNCLFFRFLCLFLCILQLVFNAGELRLPQHLVHQNLLFEKANFLFCLYDPLLLNLFLFIPLAELSTIFNHFLQCCHSIMISSVPFKAFREQLLLHFKLSLKDFGVQAASFGIFVKLLFLQFFQENCVGQVQGFAALMSNLIQLSFIVVQFFFFDFEQSCLQVVQAIKRQGHFLKGQLYIEQFRPLILRFGPNALQNLILFDFKKAGFQFKLESSFPQLALKLITIYLFDEGIEVKRSRKALYRHSIANLLLIINVVVRLTFFFKRFCPFL